MISIFLEAALRSLVLAVAVWAGLRLFRVGNVIAGKAAWALVLTAAVLMPGFVPIAAQWNVLPAGVHLVLPVNSMTLLEELRATLESRRSISRQAQPGPAVAPQADSALTEETAKQAPEKTSAGANPGLDDSSSFQAAPLAHAPLRIASRSLAPSPVVVALSLYLLIALALIGRLLYGLVAAMRIWHRAKPITADFCLGLPVRASVDVPSPVTIGSGVVLPADYVDWEREKLRVVLAHEQSHVRQGDFYLQFVAGLYAAAFWFSPLGWWLKRKLSDLAEAISDKAALVHAASRPAYAQILLEFAAGPRPTLIGVAMARSSRISHRIERLLNESSFHQAFAGTRRRAVLAVLMVSVALFAVAAIHMQAAGQSPEPPAPVTAPTASIPPNPEAAPVPPAAPDGSMNEVEPVGPVVAAMPGAPAAPPLPLAMGTTVVPEGVTVAPAAPVPPVPSVPPAASNGDEKAVASFDRTLSVSGQVQLSVGTGSGDIRLTTGSGTQVQIHAQIRVGREGSEEQAREIAANPPIEQNGNVIRIGAQHEEHWQGISINYQIEAPADALLSASSGSGNITDNGVGQNAKLNTGSGDINATGLQGAYIINTGSGNIETSLSGAGDGKVQTGSGDIEIKDIHGGLRAITGSGDIKASGTPSAAWQLQTGSGNVELWPGNAPLTLDASTGSGSIITDHPMVMQGSLNTHHITGNLNGGGPTVRLETGSGDIHVH